MGNQKLKKINKLPYELKHLSNKRKKKSTEILQVVVSENRLACQHKLAIKYNLIMNYKNSSLISNRYILGLIEFLEGINTKEGDSPVIIRL